MNHELEDGYIIGNVYSKYENNNPIAQFLVNGFLKAFDELSALPSVDRANEIGCGEGFLSKRLANLGYQVSASDFSSKIIETAKQLNPDDRIKYYQRNIYDQGLEVKDRAPFIVCCEVLEHLESPEAALQTLSSLEADWYLFSVPREPVWRIMNMARLKYWDDLGNTPGHLQHWGQGTFLKLLDKHFTIKEIRSPIPWTMVLCQR